MVDSSEGRDVTLCEVAPRDGLQNEARAVSVEERVALIDRLSACGLPRIEAVSFVNPKRVPQMAGAEDVMSRVYRRPGVTYAGLVLNERGAERAVAAGMDEIHFAMAATETFNQRNQGSSIADTVMQFQRVAALAHRESVSCTATIGVAFGCPFEGRVLPSRVLDLAVDLSSAGAQEINIADTVGAAVPTQVTELVEALHDQLTRAIPLGCHFHNTRNTGLANAYAAILSGVRILDASVGGIGGCPFAPKASGNIATEDLANMLTGMGYTHHVKLESLIENAKWLETLLDRPLPGMVMKAGLFSVGRDRALATG